MDESNHWAQERWNWFNGALRTGLPQLWNWFTKKWFEFLTIIFAGTVAVISTCSYHDTSAQMQKQLELTRQSNELTDFNMKEQTTELKRATQLEWRPYLNVEADSTTYMLCWREKTIPQIEDNLLIDCSPLPSVLLNSADYDSCNYLTLWAIYRFKYTNTGRTPLRMLARRMFCFSPKDWQDKYGKSAESLVAHLQHRFPYEVDFIVPPDSSTKASHSVRIVGVMAKDEFEQAMVSDSIVVFYSAIVFEYEDMFSNQYNTVVVNYWKVRVRQKDKRLFYNPGNFECGLERLRWDLSLPPDTNQLMIQ